MISKKNVNTNSAENSSDLEKEFEILRKYIYSANVDEINKRYHDRPETLKKYIEMIKSDIQKSTRQITIESIRLVSNDDDIINIQKLILIEYVLSLISDIVCDESIKPIDDFVRILQMIIKEEDTNEV